jgi:hypothetical protein
MSDESTTAGSAFEAYMRDDDKRKASLDKDTEYLLGDDKVLIESFMSRVGLSEKIPTVFESARRYQTWRSTDRKYEKGGEFLAKKFKWLSIPVIVVLIGIYLKKEWRDAHYEILFCLVLAFGLIAFNVIAMFFCVRHIKKGVAIQRNAQVGIDTFKDLEEIFEQKFQDLVKVPQTQLVALADDLLIKGARVYLEYEDRVVATNPRDVDAIHFEAGVAKEKLRGLRGLHQTLKYRKLADPTFDRYLALAREKMNQDPSSITPE